MTAMPARANPEPDGEHALALYGDALAGAIEAALPAWVLRCVERVLLAWQGSGEPVAEDVLAAAVEAGERARIEVGAQVRALLTLDIDEQRTNPLSLLRRAVSYPTEVLRAAGVGPVVRDRFDERAFPEDIYGLAPASFADVDPALHEAGIAWGAAKAHLHLARRRRR